MTLRFVVTVGTGWEVTLTCPDLPGWTPPVAGPTALGRMADGRGGFLPQPEYELHEPDVDHGTLGPPDAPEAVLALYDAVRLQFGTPAQYARFGHYLFDVLLGHKRWSDLLQLAEAEGHREIELALALPPGDKDLGRLNWELLRSPGAFVAAGTNKVRVAITRLVVPEHPVVPEQLSIPPRALFVIGTPMLDPRIRPAAELNTLLKLARGGRAMRYRVLEKAQPKLIKQAIVDFEPEIVHFIGHGNSDDEGKVYLELRSDEDDKILIKRYASQLLADLRLARKPATIVILSACKTGGAPGTERLFRVDETAPMAAELVKGGIPIVVGMAGQISDVASRLFARTFGESIMHGRPLTMAAADALTAAFADADNPETTIDWALPTVFLSSAVPTGYRPLEGDETTARWRRIQGWIKAYDGGAEPVFCGREEFLQKFHSLFGPDAPDRVLAAYTAARSDGMGRTRLLRELAAHAIRDGHLPVLVTPELDQPAARPDDLARIFADEISRVRGEVLELGQTEPDQLRALDFPERETLKPDVWGAIRGGEVTVLAVARAIRHDLTDLLRDARAKYDPDFTGQVVVLIDDVNRFGAMIDELLGKQGLFTANGLGSIADPVPVVLTWTLGGLSETRLEKLAAGQRSVPAIDAVELRAFDVDAQEDLLAYKTVLLNPFLPAGPRANILVNTAWVFNPEKSPEQLENVYAALRESIEGIPINFHDKAFRAWATMANNDGYLVMARDEDRLPRRTSD